MRVAIVGATGLIGRKVVEALVARGDEVVALARRGRRHARGATTSAGIPRPGAAARRRARRRRRGRQPGRRADRGRRWNADASATSARAASLTDRPRRRPRRRRPPRAGQRQRRGLLRQPRGGRSTRRPRRAPASWPRPARRGSARRARPRRHGVRVVLMRIGHRARRATAAPCRRWRRRSSSSPGGPIGGGRQWLPWIHIDDEVGLILRALDRRRARRAAERRRPGTPGRASS